MALVLILPYKLTCKQKKHCAPTSWGSREAVLSRYKTTVNRRNFSKQREVTARNNSSINFLFLLFYYPNLSFLYNSDTIRKQFSECTILAVAHRLSTVMDYDR
jgi:hypothetical protein